MRLTFTTQAGAQTRADQIHAWIIAKNLDYAASVTKGGTTAAMIPYQDRQQVAIGQVGAVIGTSWYLNVKDRHLGALTAPEIASLT